MHYLNTGFLIRASDHSQFAKLISSNVPLNLRDKFFGANESGKGTPTQNYKSSETLRADVTTDGQIHTLCRNDKGPKSLQVTGSDVAIPTSLIVTDTS